MPAKKTAAKKKPSAPAAPATPEARRPRMPKEYGIPADKKGMLSWDHITQRMTASKYYWLCTVTSGNRPWSNPVDGLWIDGRLYFGGSPQTRWNRNLLQNNEVSIHLESASDVVIMYGAVSEGTGMGRAMAEKMVEGTKAKYGYAMPVELYEKGEGVQVFTPRRVVACTSFPKDVTRWDLG
ncbi:MAG: pyridoxamine 5'-phosphate oxidase family protein [Blastocatellia bacterium]